MLWYTSIILLICLNSYVKTNENYNVKQCYISKLMLYFFHINETSFKKSFAADKSTFSIEDLKLHGLYLQQSLGETVLVMLEELNSDKTNYGLPEDLMTINLYLNNVLETLLVSQFDGVCIFENTQRNLFYKDEFIQSYTEILDVIVKSINQICPTPMYNRNYCCNVDIVIAKNSLTKYHSGVDPKSKKGVRYDGLNDLFPNNYSDYDCKMNMESLKQQMDYLNNSILEAKHIFGVINDVVEGKKDELSNFHPRNMFFCHLLSVDQKKISENVDMMSSDDWLRQVHELDYRLFLNVTLNAKLENGNHATIADLFEMVQRLIDVKCLKTFQRQVLAASAHPMLTVVGSYVLLVINMSNAPTKAKICDQEIKDLGNRVHRAFAKFIQLKILPEKVQRHLNITLVELNNLIKYPRKESVRKDRPEWIETVFSRCSSPMLLNGLNFLGKDHSMKLETEKDCNKVIDALNTNTATIEKYVEKLGEYKKDYEIVVNWNTFVSYENMFVEKSDNEWCDIVNGKKLGKNIYTVPRENGNAQNQFARLLEV